MFRKEFEVNLIFAAYEIVRCLFGELYKTTRDLCGQK
jgi:hypothetical protein